jgi:tetratricopeptide (TPR) repeat protein
LYLQGRGYLQGYDKRENIENAITVFERALTLDPDYAMAQSGLGQAYWLKYQLNQDMRLVKSAREACERAWNLDAKLASALICLGTIASGSGRHEEAIAEFDRAVEAEPTSDDAYRGLADAYEGLGKHAEAENTYRQAIALRPQYWASYNWLGALYYNQARYSEAAAMFNQVTALVPDSFRGYSNLGATYVAQGRYVDAIAVLERSIAIRRNAQGYSNLGNAYFYLRRYGDATGAYEQAVKLEATDYRLWWNVAEGYYWTPGKRSEAASAYLHAISLAREKLEVNPKDVDAVGALAFCHAMLNERKSALEYLRQGLQLAPEDPGMQFKAALVHIQFSEIDQALGWLKKAVDSGYSPVVVRDTPNFDPLRSDPRFQDLVRRVGVW